MKMIVILVGVILMLAAGGMYVFDSSGKASLAQKIRMEGRKLEAISGQANPAMNEEAPILDPLSYLVMGGIGVLVTLGGAMMQGRSGGS